MLDETSIGGRWRGRPFFTEEISVSRSDVLKGEETQIIDRVKSIEGRKDLVRHVPPEPKPQLHVSTPLHP